jgi:pyridoxal phosphate enzyme (YggS family)
MDFVESIRRNVESVEERIFKSCQRVGRSRKEIQLVAVSKTFPAEVVLAACEAGLRAFGENRVYEAAEKIHAVRRVFPASRGEEDRKERVDLPPTPSSGKADRVKWHLIGHLQTNKAKLGVELFDIIQSVDRFEIAQKLDRYCEPENRLLPVLIQVNVGAEETKSGIGSGGALALVQQVAVLKHLRIRGLMAIPPYRDVAEESRQDFRALRLLAEQIAENRIGNVSMNELSIGMSHDFEVAIEEGATMIRVGTAIFGERCAPKG